MKKKTLSSVSYVVLLTDRDLTNNRHACGSIARACFYHTWRFHISSKGEMHMELTISMCNVACQRQMVYVHAVDLLLKRESLNGPAHTHIYLLQYMYNANQLFFFFPIAGRLFPFLWTVVGLLQCYTQTSGRSLMKWLKNYFFSLSLFFSFFRSRTRSWQPSGFRCYSRWFPSVLDCRWWGFRQFCSKNQGYQKEIWPTGNNSTRPWAHPGYNRPERGYWIWNWALWS